LKAREIRNQDRKQTDWKEAPDLCIIEPSAYPV